MSEKTGRRWRRAVMYSNLLVAAVAPAYLLGTYAILGLPLSVPLLIAGACGTFIVYQADRAIFVSPEDQINQPDRVRWVRDHATYVYGSTATAAVIGLATLPYLHPIVRWAAALYAALGTVYALSIGGDRFRHTRVHVGKPLVITLGWAVGGAIIPALHAGAAMSMSVAMLATYRLGFVLPNTLLADWLDREGDVEHGVYTPAAFLSAGSLRRLCQVILLATSIGALAAVYFWDAPRLLAIDAVGPLLMLFLLRRGLPGRRWFYLVTLDGLIAWPAATALFYYLR